jgi:hypothetical protein
MAYCKNVLSESVWLTLDESTQSYLREWDEVVSLINENSYLFETDLTLQQIQQIFQNAEKYAIGSDQFKTKTGVAIGAAGSAANVAGKAVAGTLRVGKDITAATVRQISDKVNELGKAIQDTTPVQNADAVFKQAQKDLYDKLGGKDAKVNQIIHKMAELAKEHPGKTKVLIAALTTAAAVAGGPAGGAGAGFVLRSANELLKGESLSTAVGKSVKVAAMGAALGAFADMVADATDIGQPSIEGGPAPVSSEVSTQDIQAEPEAEEILASLPDTVEEYRLQHAQSLIDQMAAQADAWSPEMKQKLADMINITGEYPDNFDANWDGSVYRGNIVMTPDEEVAFRRFYGSIQPEPMMRMQDGRVSEWLTQNVSGVAENNALEAQLQAEYEAEYQAKLDAMSPEEREEFLRRQPSMWQDF